MSMVAARLDMARSREFELLAKMQHKTKSQLLKELINKYLQENRQSSYIIAAKNIAKHEKKHPDECADIYDLRQDWE
jgi:predicted DNA-binding protein